MKSWFKQWLMRKCEEREATHGRDEVYNRLWAQYTNAVDKDTAVNKTKDASQEIRDLMMIAARSPMQPWRQIIGAE